MSLQGRVTAVAKGTNKLAIDFYIDRSTSTFNCGICLWVFESKSELDIHNYLEHIAINHIEHRKNIEDPLII
jgi:hypothetical protein